MSEPEHGSTSDTKSRKRVVRVRTWSNFGHRKQETSSQSPNLVQLRTQKAGKEDLESEPGPTSDRGSGKRVVRV
ncbi:hypothetical protein [Cytobacillus firmus]